MDSDISHASDCVFYDSELRLFRRSFDDCYRVLKQISKRAERRQTVQISKSLFDYSERKTDFRVCPQKYFDFRMDEFRICIYLYKGRYSVLCVGWCPKAESMERKDFIGSGRLFGLYRTYKEAFPVFRKFVLAFVDEYIRDWDESFYDKDIPF